MKKLLAETERLRLRLMEEDDAEAVFAWMGDERVAEYMRYTRFQSVLQVKEWLNSIKPQENSFLIGFERKSDNTLIGSGAVGYVEKEKAWGLGYNIRHDCWNQGYTTEAVKAMMRFVIDHFDAQCFYTEHALANPASGRVLEKCGLSFSHYGVYAKEDQSRSFRAGFYRGHVGTDI